MNRAAFEELVSAWLDEPERADLRARLEQAVAADPARARVRDEYARLEELIRQATSAPVVDWPEFKARVVAEIDRLAEEAGRDAALDGWLRTALPDIEQRVDWTTLQARVSQAIDRQVVPVSRRRLVRGRVSIAAGFLAAAAAVVLWFSLPAAETPSVAPPGAVPQVYLEILPPAEEAAIAAEVVSVTIHEDPAVAMHAAPHFSASEPPAESDPEIYFMLEPPDATLTMAAAYGSSLP